MIEGLAAPLDVITLCVKYGVIFRKVKLEWQLKYTRLDYNHIYLLFPTVL